MSEVCCTSAEMLPHSRSLKTERACLELVTIKYSLQLWQINQTQPEMGSLFGFTWFWKPIRSKTIYNLLSNILFIFYSLYRLCCVTKSPTGHGGMKMGRCGGFYSNMRRLNICKRWNMSRKVSRHRGGNEESTGEATYTSAHVDLLVLSTGRSVCVTLHKHWN